MSKIKIALIILGLVLFPIAVQVLFCFHAPVRVLEANWTAGEILTYVGTAFLGFIAFIQNDSLKKANDEAQEKLAQLTSEANELSVLARIIDYELNKKITLPQTILITLFSIIMILAAVNIPALGILTISVSSLFVVIAALSDSKGVFVSFAINPNFWNCEPLTDIRSPLLYMDCIVLRLSLLLLF